MHLDHVNRRGDRYFIFQGQTKTGKPKYFASKRPTSEKGEPVEVLPAAFEVFENPGNATVTVRRRKPSRVLPAERDLVDRLTRELSAYSCVHTIIDGDEIVVYTPNSNPARVNEVFSRLFGLAAASLADVTSQFTNSTAELRFTLKDVDKRIFTAQRFCYRGSVEDWIWAGGPGPLERLVRKLVPHLGRDSFYEIF